MMMLNPRNVCVGMALAALGCGEAVPEAHSVIESEGVIGTGPVLPETHWGHCASSWRSPRHQCVANSKMLIDGCDNRNPAPSGCPRPEPFSFIGHLEHGCTGTLIAPTWVLTAAHCVVNSRNELIATSQKYTHARNGACVACGSVDIPIKKVYVPKLYNESVTSDLEHRKAVDLAMVELDAPVPGSPDKFPQVPPTDWAHIWNATLYSVGYPGDLGNGKFAYSAVGEYETMKAFPPGVHLIKTDLDGSGGQSGSPVYIIRNNQRLLTAVLVGSPPRDCQLGYNWAPKLTQWVYDRIIYPPMLQGWSSLSDLDVLTYPSLGAPPSPPGGLCSPKD